jgi:Ran GTPase-activating protein (RanGAP) involved in mRNA processing and transport
MYTCFLADISDIIAGRPTEEALKTLHIICSSLKKFNLVIVNVSDNALGPKGIEACRGVLTSSSLEVCIHSR